MVSTGVCYLRRAMQVCLAACLLENTWSSLRTDTCSSALRICSVLTCRRAGGWDTSYLLNTYINHRKTGDTGVRISGASGVLCSEQRKRGRPITAANQPFWLVYYHHYLPVLSLLYHHIIIIASETLPLTH